MADRPCHQPIDMYIFLLIFIGGLPHGSWHAQTARFVVAQARGPHGRGRAASPSPGCDGSAVSRESLLRRARSGAGEIRDAAAGPPRRAVRLGSGRRFRLLTAVVLHGSGGVSTSGSPGVAAAETGPAAGPQTDRRRTGSADDRAQRGRIRPTRGGVSHDPAGSLWHHRTSAQYRTQPRGVHRATGKKTAVVASPVTSDPDVYAAQYEVLRAHMIGQAGAASRGVGLALLMQHGLAAWMGAVRNCTSPARPVVPTGRTGLPRSTDRDIAAAVPQRLPADVLPPTLYTEAASLLAGVVLSCARWRAAHPDHGGLPRC